MLPLGSGLPPIPGAPARRLRWMESPSDPAFPAFWELYELSFPPEERDSRQSMEWWCSPGTRQLLPEGRLPVILVVEQVADSQPMLEGFHVAVLSLPEGIAYLGYLALQPGLRNQGLGSWLMQAGAAFHQQLAAWHGVTYRGTLFEIEHLAHAHDEEDRSLRHRRRRWYERLGASVIAEEFLQPSLGPGLPEVPLHVCWLPVEPGPHDPAALMHFLRTRIYDLHADPAA